MCLLWKSWRQVGQREGAAKVVVPKKKLEVLTTQWRVREIPIVWERESAADIETSCPDLVFSSQGEMTPPQGASAATGWCLVRKSHPAQGPAPAAAGAARALFPMKLVLPGCSVPALRPQGLLLFKSLSVNPQSFLSPMLKHANSLMLHPCSRNMLWFLSAKAPLWKRVTFHHMGKKPWQGFPADLAPTKPAVSPEQQSES